MNNRKGASTMKTKIRPPPFCKDTLEDTWNVENIILIWHIT